MAECFWEGVSHLASSAQGCCASMYLPQVALSRPECLTSGRIILPTVTNGQWGQDVIGGPDLSDLISKSSVRIFSVVEYTIVSLWPVRPSVHPPN